MQHTSAAQQHPGTKPASETSMTQNKPKTPTRDLILNPKFKHPPSQHRDTIAAGQNCSGETEAVAICIHDMPSPPSQTGPMTHATPRAAPRIQDPAEMTPRRPKFSPWQALYHPFGEGYVQAGTVLRQAQRKKHGTQTLPPPQGQLQKLAPHMHKQQ